MKNNNGVVYEDAVMIEKSWTKLSLSVWCYSATSHIVLYWCSMPYSKIRMLILKVIFRLLGVSCSVRQVIPLKDISK